MPCTSRRLESLHSKLGYKAPFGPHKSPWWSFPLCRRRRWGPEKSLTEKMEPCQVLANCGCGFQTLLCLAQGQRHHLRISSCPCPANAIVHPRLGEFLSGSSTCGGHLEMCGSFLASVIWGGGNNWYLEMRTRDLNVLLHAGLPHKVKTSAQIFNSIAVQKHKRASFPS